MNNPVFPTLVLYFIDFQKKTLSRFGVVDNLPGLLDIFQILLDSCTTGLSEVTAHDVANDRYLNAAKIAEYYGMRKRTFDEKLSDVKTYNLEVTEK